MPIAVSCQCGARFAAKDDLAGRAVRCPKCKQPLKIPAPETVPASGVASLLDEIGFAQEGGAVRCPACSMGIGAGTVNCPHCGYNLQTGTYALKAEEEPREPAAKYDWKGLKQRMKEDERSRRESRNDSNSLDASDFFLLRFFGVFYILYLLVSGDYKKGLKLLIFFAVLVVVAILVVALSPHR